jgi:hypothetical protein
MRWRNVDRLMVLLALLVAVGGLALGAWFMVEMTRPVREWITVSEPLMLGEAKRGYRSGDPIAFRVNYCQAREAVVQVGVMYASAGYVAVSPVMMSALPSGCHEVGFQTALPLGMRPGSYRAYLIVSLDSGLMFYQEPVRVTSEVFYVQE